MWVRLAWTPPSGPCIVPRCMHGQHRVPRPRGKEYLPVVAPSISGNLRGRKGSGRPAQSPAFSRSCLLRDLWQCECNAGGSFGLSVGAADNARCAWPAPGARAAASCTWDVARGAVRLPTCGSRHIMALVWGCGRAVPVHAYESTLPNPWSHGTLALGCVRASRVTVSWLSRTCRAHSRSAMVTGCRGTYHVSRSHGARFLGRTPYRSCLPRSVAPIPPLLPHAFLPAVHQRVTMLTFPTQPHHPAETVKGSRYPFGHPECPRSRA